jgi:tetratricopeptide (TPR) repeat protein
LAGSTQQQEIVIGQDYTEEGKVNEGRSASTQAYNKGVNLYNIGKYQEYIEYYDKALALDPNFVSALYNKGNALNDLERYQEAIEYYN